MIVDLVECEPTDVEVNVSFELPERMQSALNLFSDAKELEANARAGEAARKRIVVLMAESPSYIDAEATTELSKMLSSMASSEPPAVGA